MKRFLKSILSRRFYFSVGYPLVDAVKLSRKIVFSHSGDFLDLGGGDGKLSYLLTNKLRPEFISRYRYYLSDIEQDICQPIEVTRQYDVIYSNNVFEHLLHPEIAARNVYNMLKPGGIVIIIAPFAWRYHESPGDYYRYSHTVFPALFKECGDIEVIASGYDITHRHHYNQGSGKFNDKVPGYKFNESWMTISIIKKL